MEMKEFQVKPGQIINEYDIRKTDYLYSSYMVLKTSGWANQQWYCFCLFNQSSDVNDKPGDICYINKDWIRSYSVAKQKDWPTYWRVENGH